MTFSNLLRSGGAAGLFILALPACGGDEAATPPKVPPLSNNQIEARDYIFTPEETTVKAGSTVTWTFNDPADHNVEPVGESELKKSPDLQGGETYAATFTKPGTIEYRCGIHNQMTGKIVVTS